MSSGGSPKGSHLPDRANILAGTAPRPDMFQQVHLWLSWTVKSEVHRNGRPVRGFWLYTERYTNTGRCKILLEFNRAQSYLKGRNSALLKPVISCFQSWGRVKCSCRSLCWHGDPSSTHGPLRWCIGCVSRGWQLGWPQWEEAKPAGWAPASQPRSTHHTWTKSCWSASKRSWPFSPKLSPPGTQDSYSFGQFPSFSALSQHRPHKDNPTTFRATTRGLNSPS